MKQKRILFILILIIGIILLVGCDTSISVDFMVDNELYASIEVDGTSLVDMPKSPTKEGYTFVGWYLDEAYETAFDETSIVEKSITLYAKFEILYSIKFVDMNGSTLRSAKVASGTVPTTPTVSDIVTDEYTYKFIGWDKEVVTASSDETYTAQYEAVKTEYKLTYNLSGGTSDDVELEIAAAHGTTMALGLVAEREGYVFLGWYIGEEKITEVTITSNIEVYAKWSELYTIIFLDKNNEVIATEYVEVGEMPKAPEVSDINMTTYVYVFANWDSEIVIATSDKTYTAQYTITANYYLLTYDINGGTMDGESTQSYIYGTKVTLPTEVEREGYEFIGWMSNQEIVESVVMTQVTKVTAQWIKIYTIKFEYMDSEYSKKITVEQSVKEGSEPEAPEVFDITTEANEYEFIGWDEEVLLASEDKTYTAVYATSIRSYTITYDSNGGQITAGQQLEIVEVEYNSTIVMTDAPDASYTGRELLGWSTTKYEADIVSVIEVTADITLYAIWESESETEYLIWFLNGYGEQIEEQIVKEGETPTEPDVALSIVVNGERLYFIGWSSEIVPAYEHTTYMAIYE